MNDVFSKQLIIEIENGRKVAKVPLGKIGEASLWASDLAELIALGVSLNWTIAPPGSNQVRVHGRKDGDLLIVPRLIMDAGPNQQVKHLDGAKLNLRRENLFLVPGYAIRRDRDCLTPLERIRRERSPQETIQSLGLLSLAF
jgi:hypothetical protein